MTNRSLPGAERHAKKNPRDLQTKASLQARKTYQPYYVQTAGAWLIRGQRSKVTS